MKIRMRFCNTFSTFVLLKALLVAVVISGCGTFGGGNTKSDTPPENEWIKDMRARILKQIEDPNKQNAMLLIVDQTEMDLADLNQILRKFYENLRALNNEYEASPDAYREVITIFESERKTVADRIKASRFQLVELSTPEEWKTLTAYRKSKGLYKQSIIQSIE